MNVMNEVCPHSGGRLIEKHEEVETERGERRLCSSSSAV